MQSHARTHAWFRRRCVCIKRVETPPQGGVAREDALTKRTF
jgi:hypothetical protein